MIKMFLDFESFWDTKDKYSLRVMKTIDYVRDERFEPHGASIRIDNGDTYWVHRDDLQAEFDKYDWEQVILICHNTYFDGLILWEHFGKIPAAFHCTLCMARALFPYMPGGHGLDSVNKFFGGEGKIEGLKETNGVRLDDMPADIYNNLVTYAIEDDEILVYVYEKMLPMFPQDELELMSITLKWGCVPLVHFDVPKAEKLLAEHLEEVKQVIEDGGVAKTTLSSNQKFAAFISDDLGLTPPVKLNDDKEETWAFSKDDLQFQEFMADHPEHTHIWKARLAAKSTITRTRLQSLIHIGTTGPLPMPLKYCGAHTLRWSGGDGVNPQNWPREGGIRSCIMAPPGYEFVVFDQKQIELRMNMWFCGEWEWLRVLHEEDIYKVTAADHFGVTVDQVTPEQRFFGKTIELGLGYGMGWSKFRRQCALRDIHLSEAEAQRTVNHYRWGRPGVPAMQQRLNAAIMNMLTGEPLTIGPLTFIKGAVQMPNGMELVYSNLEYKEWDPQTEKSGWFYGKPGLSKKGKHYKSGIYGGLFLENIIQCLARLVMAQNILDIERELDYATLVTTTHDEAAALVRSAQVPDAMRDIASIMGRAPSWAPELPLVGEGGHDTRYAK